MKISGLVNQENIELDIVVVPQVTVVLRCIPGASLADHDAGVAALGEIIPVDGQDGIHSFGQTVAPYFR